MTHKQHIGLLNTTKISLDERRYVMVFVWDNIESMYMANDRAEHDYLARCIAMSVLVTNDLEVKTGRKFAELHFVRNEYGSGVVAHEIQHLMNYWVYYNQLDWMEDDEEIAYLCGEITNKFWLFHYSLH